MNTGGATTIIDYDLTPNRVVISDADNKISTSSVSNIEVGYLAGTNDLIQTQLNSKANHSTTYSKTEVDNKLVLKASQATTYTKAAVDSNLASKQNKLTFPSTEGSNRWGSIADATNIVRRLVGAQPTRAFIELDVDNPSSINDVQIGLDIESTGLTSCYSKTETKRIYY